MVRAMGRFFGEIVGNSSRPTLHARAWFPNFLGVDQVMSGRNASCAIEIAEKRKLDELRIYRFDLPMQIFFSHIISPAAVTRLVTLLNLFQSFEIRSSAGAESQ